MITTTPSLQAGRALPEGRGGHCVPSLADSWAKSATQHVLTLRYRISQRVHCSDLGSCQAWAMPGIVLAFHLKTLTFLKGETSPFCDGQHHSPAIPLPSFLSIPGAHSLPRVRQACSCSFSFFVCVLASAPQARKRTQGGSSLFRAEGEHTETVQVGCENGQVLTPRGVFPSCDWLSGVICMM